MKTKYFLSVILVLGVLSLDAQNVGDLLRYSNTQVAGTARYLGTAGAFGAFGAEFSTLSSNPAGIGMYKKSEFTFSPQIFDGNTTSDFFGKSYEDNKLNFNISNFGLIMAGDNEETGFKNFQIGIGVNRLANFNNRSYISADNPNSSLIDDYLAKANGHNYNDLDEFDTYLAYQTYLIDPNVNDTTQYTSVIPSGGVNQSRTSYTSGGINEMVFSAGGNYNDKLYIGATIGFPFINYYQNSTYTESDIADTIADFKSYSVYEDIETHGTGVNFKLGLIYKATKSLRLGLAIHSPTYYSMYDSYTTSIKSDWDNGSSYTSTSPDGNTGKYRMTTPWRALGSVGLLIGRKGFIDVDYEYVDYTEASFRSGSVSGTTQFYNDINNEARLLYSGAHNIRIGGEIRHDLLRFRAGFAYYDNPYNEDYTDADETSYVASIGFGYYQKEMFIDFAYSHAWYNQQYYLYPSVGSVSNNEVKTNRFMCTVGLKF